MPACSILFLGWEGEFVLVAVFILTDGDGKMMLTWLMQSVHYSWIPNEKEIWLVLEGVRGSDWILPGAWWTGDFLCDVC